MADLEGMKLVDYKKLIADDPQPTELHRITNEYNQEVIFYEHPIYGEETPVLGVIGGTEVAFNTGSWDCGSFYEKSDYLPVLYDGQVVSNFQLYYLDLKSGFDKNLIGKLP